MFNYFCHIINLLGILRHLTEEELVKWKTGDEDIQQEIIDDADWDLVRDKPIDDYGDVEFVEED